MRMPHVKPVRVILIATRRGTSCEVDALARKAGALVTQVDSEATAVEYLRRAEGDLVMMEADLDVPAFVARLRAERIAVPVIACGSGRADARVLPEGRDCADDYAPLPVQHEPITPANLSGQAAPWFIVAGCEAMKGVVQYGLSMAATTAPILIQGESGTGKELMARLIHAGSNRPGHFLTIECQGVAPEILELELFGRKPGDHSQRPGRLGEASGGTIFLRGVEALTPALQARLHDALQTSAICGMGTHADARTAARLITSANDITAALVERGQFRADLLARLSLAKINLPPLRERNADIDALSCCFAQRFAALYELPVRPYDDEAAAILHSYAWPGNVRELEETVHRATLLSRTPRIGADALVHANGARLDQAHCKPSDEILVDRLVGHTVAEVERELILQTLESCGGNRTSASSVLGISVRTLRNKLKTFVQAGISVSPSH